MRRVTATVTGADTTLTGPTTTIGSIAIGGAITIRSVASSLIATMRGMVVWTVGARAEHWWAITFGGMASEYALTTITTGPFALGAIIVA